MVLELNVDKTKEMLIDFRKVKTDPDPVILKGKRVERVHSWVIPRSPLLDKRCVYRPGGHHGDL